MYPRSSHEMITCTFSTTPFQFAKAMAPYIPRALPLLPEIERHAHVEEFISSSGADIYYGGSHACYVPSLDEVHLPPLGAFQSAEAYYSRSEEHTSELQSLMRISYAVFCLKKKKNNT